MPTLRAEFARIRNNTAIHGLSQGAPSRSGTTTGQSDTAPIASILMPVGAPRARENMPPAKIVDCVSRAESGYRRSFSRHPSMTTPVGVPMPPRRRTDQTAPSYPVPPGRPTARQPISTRARQSGKYLTTAQGLRLPDTDHSLKAGEGGPSLLEDFHLREKITDFDHERIPERVVHARGAAAHGVFESYGTAASVTKAGFLAPGQIPPQQSSSLIATFNSRPKLSEHPGGLAHLHGMVEALLRSAAMPDRS
jgi:hypothetical protein